MPPKKAVVKASPSKVRIPDNDSKRIDKTKSQIEFQKVENGSKEINPDDNAEEATAPMEEQQPEEVIIPPKKLYIDDFAVSFDDGKIDLAYAENLQYESSPECYPKTYYTLAGKERLLLLYAENFRQQFTNVYPKRLPLLLAPKNECGVQKIVCTTIRPTAFLYPSLASDFKGCASFVADFIEYQPLENPLALPPCMVSPTTLISRRRGNSFEMANLLCSMLTGAGYPALVVSGSATRETIMNDQRNVEYTLPEDPDYTQMDKENNEGTKTVGSDKYKLKPKPDLTSHLEEQLEQKKLEREYRENFEREEALRIEREALEEAALFNDPCRLRHAWVVIINNAPWSIKPQEKIIDEDGELVSAPPSAIFIEPSTGFVHSTSSKAYIHIESIWNNLNYYVNLQPCQIREMQWDLRDTSNWEHILVGEPPEMRVEEKVSEENLLEEMHKDSNEKHLDMGLSWVKKIEITDKEMDELFPHLHKEIYYRRVIHERFSNYTQPDGKVEQVTLFSDDNYEVPEIRWIWYKNREDFLTRTKYTFTTAQTEESFDKGRPDCLKYFIINANDKLPKHLYFYSSPRMDALRVCEIQERMIMAQFDRIPGQCYFKEFVTKRGMSKLLEMTEKFHRDTTKPANKDIASRTFQISKNKILLKFHYVHGALTAEVREFTKPPKPDYGQEIIFDPAMTVGYKYGDTNPQPTQLELYLMLLDQLKAEENAKKAFDKIIEEYTTIIERRKRENKQIELKINPFDPLRNTEARRLRLERDEIENQIKRERDANVPDFLAPYLIPYSGRTLTKKESWIVYNACLNDLKNRFVSLLNDLQRQYEDLTAEAQSLKKFLGKFHNKFDDFDYDRLLQKSKDLELRKRMVQRRLTLTHEDAQKKYDTIKQSLLKDERLNLS